MKKFFVALLLLLIVLLIIHVTGGVLSIPKTTDLNLEELKGYCKSHNYNDSIIILVNFGQHSGQCRMGLYINNELNLESVCAHGIGKKGKSWLRPSFSNEVESNLSCLGKFKLIRERKFSNQYVKNWDGIELEGLDSTNSNARKRGILIHKGYDYPMYPLPELPVSLGCFVISSEMYDTLINILTSTKKPIILYAYNPKKG